MALPPTSPPDWSQPVTPGLTDNELKELSRWIQGPVMRSTPLVKAIEKILRDRALTIEITQHDDAPTTCRISKNGFVLFNGRDYSADIHHCTPNCEPFALDNEMKELGYDEG